MDPDRAELLREVAAALEAAPGSVALRVHYAQLLAEAGRRDEALAQLGWVLGRDPGHAEAQRLRDELTAAASGHEAGFDWGAAEQELGDTIEPRFVEFGSPAGDSVDVERAGTKLADVAGMDDVKRRIEAQFLAPLRNPELRAFFGKELRGGLLLYGPPGCGKTFLARAVAGELGAGFVAVELADILTGGWANDLARSLRDAFEVARRNRPCVLFFDELDALGQRRARVGGALRTLVNQLLEETDGLRSDNHEVFVLGASNHPWDIDPALTRPGRLDRMVFVPPPDESARAAIVRYHLESRPIGGIDVRRVAAITDGFSGADLARVCEAAAEAVLLEVVEGAEMRLIAMRDLEAAVADTRPSMGAWLDTAKTVGMFANTDGRYDDLVAYLQGRRLL